MLSTTDEYGLNYCQTVYIDDAELSFNDLYIITQAAVGNNRARGHERKTCHQEQLKLGQPPPRHRVFDQLCSPPPAGAAVPWFEAALPQPRALKPIFILVGGYS